MPQQEVKFGLNQIGNTTPSWAKWAFRIFFYLTQTVNLALIMFTEIPDAVKLQVTTWVQFANLAVHGLSKMFGIEPDNTSYYNQNR